MESFSFITALIWAGWLFKVLFASADTVVIYLMIYFFRKYFNLQRGEEIQL